MHTPEQHTLIGIMGGTFDPIHYGHLRAAVELYELLPIKKILFLPCQTPVHKPDALATPQHRLNMLELALRNLPFAQIDQRELLRATPSYMIETLLSLREDLPTQPLGLIIGSDAFADFTRWKRWQEILAVAHLVVVQRPGYLLPADSTANDLLNQYGQIAKSYLVQQPAGGIFIQKIHGLSISSTYIRELAKAGNNLRYLLPDSVIEYIKRHDLYINNNFMA